MMLLPAFLLQFLSVDVSGTWVGSVQGKPMCLALSQGEAAVSGNVAYGSNRTDYAAIAGGAVNGSQLSFHVVDPDRGTLRFVFRMEGEHLIAEDGAVLTKWTPRVNRQFDAGLEAPPSVIKKTDPEFSKAGRKGHGTGEVKLGVLVLPNGDVDRSDIKVYSSAGKELDEAAIASVSRWTFTPPREDCNFYEKRITVQVNFRQL